MARPSDAEILRRIAQGESLRSICRKARMGEGGLRMRMRRDPKLAARYAQAREAQADHYAELVVDGAMATRDAALGRLRMAALTWAASKLAPRKYGDKLTVAGDQAEPFKLEVTDGARERLARLVAGQLAGGGEDEGAG